MSFTVIRIEHRLAFHLDSAVYRVPFNMSQISLKALDYVPWKQYIAELLYSTAFAFYQNAK